MDLLKRLRLGVKNTSPRTVTMRNPLHTTVKSAH
jgi:hypothetical protein